MEIKPSAWDTSTAGQCLMLFFSILNSDGQDGPLVILTSYPERGRVAACFTGTASHHSMADTYYAKAVQMFKLDHPASERNARNWFNAWHIRTLRDITQCFRAGSTRVPTVSGSMSFCVRCLLKFLVYVVWSCDIVRTQGGVTWVKERGENGSLVTLISESYVECRDGFINLKSNHPRQLNVERKCIALFRFRRLSFFWLPYILAFKQVNRSRWWPADVMINSAGVGGTSGVSRSLGRSWVTHFL